MPVDLGAGPLYQLNDNRFFPSLARRAAIPDVLRSTQATQPSRVGMGVVKAVCSVLTSGKLHDLAFDASAERWSLRVASGSSPGTLHVLGGERATWWADHPGYLHGIVWMVDALTVTQADPISREFRHRWAMLLLDFALWLGGPPPYTPAQLCQVAVSSALLPLGPTRPPRQAVTVGGAATHDLMAVTDALYFFAKARAAGPDLGAIEQQPDPAPLPGMPQAIERWLYLQPPGAVVSAPAARPAARPAGSTGSTGSTSIDVAALTGAMPTLRRVVRRGGSCLITGPTGNGKSQATRLAVTDDGRRYVQMDGQPSMTDREFYGKTQGMPDATGQQQRYAWFDGPLARAFRAAAAGEPTALVIDELARFDPYYLAPLLAALDQKSGQDVRALLGLPDAVRQTVDPDAIYRVLVMPDGEYLLAPREALAIVATTNLGDEYTQSQQEFDAALLGRFEVYLEFERLAPAVRERILIDLHQLPAPVATLLVSAEDYTVSEVAPHGILRRPLNLRTCVNWAREARALQATGVTWREAVAAAANVTAIPYVCARTTQGQLERPAVDSVRDWLRQALMAQPLPVD